MVDAISASESKSPVGPSAESLLKQPVDSIKKGSANTLLKLCDPTHSAHLKEEKNPDPTVKVRMETNLDGSKTLVLPEGDLSVAEFLRAAILLDPNLKERRNPPSPLRQLTGNLQNGAILLAHEMQQGGIDKADDIIEYLYNLGNRIDAEMEQPEQPFVPKKLTEIQDMNIVYPDSVNTPSAKEAYDREIKYYLLFGKNIILPVMEENSRYENAENTPYAYLYEQWRNEKQREGAQGQVSLQALADDTDGALVDSWQTRKQFEDEYLRKILERFHKYPRLTIDFIKKSLQGGEAEDAMSSLIVAGAYQQLFGEALMGIGEKHVVEHMQTPKSLQETWRTIMGEESADIILQVMGIDQQTAVINLFTAADNLYERIKDNKDIALRAKLTPFYYLVQAFSPTEIGQSDFSSSVENREFNCTMKSLILGRMLEKYFNNDVYLFGVTRIGHVELLVREKNPQDPASPLTLGMNANVSFEGAAKDTEQTDEQSEINPPEKILPTDLPVGLDIPVKPKEEHNGFTDMEEITDRSILDAIDQAIVSYDNSANPQFFRVSPKSGYHQTLHIGPWKRLVDTSIVNNLSYEVEQEDRINLQITKALNVPAQNMLEIGSHFFYDAKDKPTAKLYFENVARLYPDWAMSWSHLSMVEPDNVVKIAYLRKSLALDISDSWTWAKLGDAYRKNGDIDFSRRSYRQSILLNPGSIDTWFMLGVTYLDGSNAPPQSPEEYTEAYSVWQKVRDAYEGKEEYSDDVAIARDELSRLDELQKDFQNRSQD